MTSLNPVFTIGMQVTEVIRLHRADRAEAAQRRAIEILTEARHPRAEPSHEAYPHQLSGGQAPARDDAIALALSPSLLIADEPTTALDVTIQAQILELLMRTKTGSGGRAILLIAHNLAVVSQIADELSSLMRVWSWSADPPAQSWRPPSIRTLARCCSASHRRATSPTACAAKRVVGSPPSKALSRICARL